ncbi:MAG: hypothetical protein CR991_05580 [Proteobacteria bacterium]|nr:MAG: hypothetical protein CR991_05580 [Pseudomonadota bacterium]
MAQLSIHLNNQIIKKIKLDDSVYLIGRGNECDIQLPERTVSSQHARLIHSNDDCFLEDLGSTNGVYINGYACQKHLLINNDMIVIGKYELLYTSTISLLTQLRQLSIHPNALKHQDAELAQLEIIQGRKQGHIIPLQRDLIQLGDHESEQISIEHALDGTYLLHTLVNGQNKTTKTLAQGDIFKIGEFMLRFNEARESATV